MPSNNCRGEIEAAIGRALTAGEYKTIARQGAKLKAAIDGAGSNQTAANTILDNFLKEREFIKDAKKMMAASREVANAGLQQRVFESGDFAWKAPGEVLKSFLISSLKVFKGARDSLGWNITTGTAQRSQAFFDHLEQEGLAQYAFSGADEKNIWQAFAALSAGQDASAFGDLAARTATLLKKHTDAIWFDKHAVGIPQGRLEDWAGPQMHDPYALARAGGNRYGSDASAKAWVDSIMPRLDWGRSFGGQFLAANDTMRANRLTEIWNQFVAHEHLKYGGNNFLKNREIHFQSPVDAYNYNAEYGNGRTLAENVFGHIQRGARDVEIAKMFGTDVPSMFRKIADGMEKIINENPDISPGKRTQALKDIKQAKYNAENKWIPALTGALVNPEHDGVAQYLAATRTAINALAAAGAAPTLVGDIPLSMRVMGEHGGRGMQGYFKSLKGAVEWMTSLSKGERSRLAASGEILLQDSASPLTHSNLEWAGFGKINRLQQFLMKYGGHTPYTDRMHMNNLVKWGNDHWNDRNLSFADLTPGQRDMFTKYGLSADEWDVIRKQDPFMVDPKTGVFTPRNIRQMDLDNFKGIAGKDASDGLLRSARTRIADKYRNLIADVTMRSTAAPDDEMRAITLQGTIPATLTGELVRNFNSLKSWTYNLMRNHLGASIYGDANPDNVGWGKAMWAFARGQGGNRGGRAGMAKFIANNLVFGSLIVTLADIRDGKKPELPTSGAEAGDLLWRGFARQGLGLYSDLLMSQLDHPEQSPFETVGRLAGPSIGDAVDLGQAAARIAKSLWNYSTDPDYDSDKVWKSIDRSGVQAGRIGYSLIPGTNFAWSKWATDYYIKDNLLDMLNPGYKDRLKQRAQQQGRPYMLAGPQ